MHRNYRPNEPSDQGLEQQIGDRLQRLRRQRLENRREHGNHKKQR